MWIFPAIDIRGGKCVRLRQGDFAQETVFGDDPSVMAKRWSAEGATYLHLVDLDGAKAGRPVNKDAIQRLTACVEIPCQLGGGIRDQQGMEEVLSWGVNRVIIGTKGLQDPNWLERMSRIFPGRVVLGIDAKNGFVATEGWLDVSAKPALTFARECRSWPLAALVYTDISTDGMMQGPNFSAMKTMAEATPLPVIASGGVTTAEDVRRLQELGLAGCIIGRALYEGRIQLREALAMSIPRQTESSKSTS